MLVDDEKHITRGMMSIIKKLGIDCDEIRECTNGQEALKILEKEKFDVVITDIRMPGLDGIAFIREAQKLEIKPKFIILSGYDDFNYAVECMRYGAQAYILKPVNKEKLLEALSRVEEEIKKERQLITDYEKKNQLIERLRINEVNHILLGKTLSTDEMREILNAINITIFNDEFYIGLLTWGNRDKKIKNGGRGTDFKNKVEDYVHELNSKQNLCFTNIEGDIVLVAKNEDFFIKLHEYLDKYYGNIYKFTIGLSDPGYSISEIRPRYLQANEAIKYGLLRSFSHIIRFRDISLLKSDTPVPVDKIKELYNAIENWENEKVSYLLMDIFNRDVICSNKIDYLESILHNINYYVFKPIMESIGLYDNDLKSEIDMISDIYNYHYLGDWLNSLKVCIEKIINYVMAFNQENKENKEIKKALKFVEEHYAEDIDMLVVSKHVNLNYSYFSFLFKECTGMNFVEYLRKVRIEKAQELLRNTDLSISLITDKVGYKSTRQFTRAFKEVVGMSPSEYRGKFA